MLWAGANQYVTYIHLPLRGEWNTCLCCNVILIAYCLKSVFFSLLLYNRYKYLISESLFIIKECYLMQMLHLQSLRRWRKQYYRSWWNLIKREQINEMVWNTVSEEWMDLFINNELLGSRPVWCRGPCSKKPPDEASSHDLDLCEQMPQRTGENKECSLLPLNM